MYQLFLQALLQPGAAANYGIITYFLQVRCPAFPQRHVSDMCLAQFFGSAARTFTTYKELVQTAQKPDYLRECLSRAARF
jgi:hypothetical protein